ncbi:MAG: FAD-dependent oxidoreductase, partial [Burkholderiales bacterium]
MHIAVIGGGWGGLAAAVELAANRIPVVLYEAAREPGGRARRIQYNGVDLDNGQHILLGAYDETLRLMKLCGVAADSLLRLPLKWYFHPDFLIQSNGLAGKLPAPLDLLGAFLKARGMSPQQKLSVIKFVTAMRLRQFKLQDDTTVDRLLDAHGQHNALRECLWEPLCVSALNTPTRIASAQIFLNVLRDGLFGGKGCSDLLIPQKNLGDIFPQPAVQYVLQNGGEVRTGAAVTAIRPVDSAFAVSTRDDQQGFSHVICAAGPHQVAFLLQPTPAFQPVLRRIEALEYEPIVTV